MSLESVMAGNGKYLIRNTTAYVGSGFEKMKGTSLLIEEGRIKKIGNGIKAPEDVEIIDGKEFFVTPGFVNAHFHPNQQINRALGVGISHDKQMDLLHATDKIKKPKDKETMSYVSVLEGLRAGTTCFQSVGSEIDYQFPVYHKMGVRAACVMISKDIIADNKKKAVRAQTWNPQERIDLAEKQHRENHSDLVRVHFGAVNVRYSSDELIKGMLSLAEKYDVHFHMHAAEGDDYVASVKERTGNRPIEHLHSIGALNRRVSLAHMTKLTDKEIGYLAESGAHVVNCPRANAYVKVGLCPVKELLEAGVNVCLGSDAAINNNSNDVRGEAHAVHDAISFRHNYLIDYKTLFSMLTINGARAMGLDKEIGTIEEGKRADIVLWDKNDTPFVPGFNYLADIIFTDGMRAHTVMIDGKPVIKEYKLVSMDEKKILQDARGVARKYKRAFDDYVAHHI